MIGTNVSYVPKLLPFRWHALSESDVVAISNTGDHVFLSNEQLDALVNQPDSLDLRTQAEYKSKFFLSSEPNLGMTRLLASRVRTKKNTVLQGPSLHIVVPTLWCGHSCSYCQVSRSLHSNGYSMSEKQLDQVCASIFESPAHNLTVEFQGGDPLLRFDLVARAIQTIQAMNASENRGLRFVVASTLHQVTLEMCEFFRDHNVYLSTSVDGPAQLHNKNRPTQGRDAYQKTIAGMELCRRELGRDAVSALMTTTRASLSQPEAIVDEYVSLGLPDIFLRPLSAYGFARTNTRLTYSEAEFSAFYERALDRVLYWNSKGNTLREVSASIALNKILSPFDAGYVDLQSPTGAGLATLVYNYDGFVYPSDEARMLAETGDTSLRLGTIGNSLASFQNHPTLQYLIENSISESAPGCQNCAFNSYCGPDPVNSLTTAGAINAPVHTTSHCKRYLSLFELLLRRLRRGDEQFIDLAYRWAYPQHRQ